LKYHEPCGQIISPLQSTGAVAALSVQVPAVFVAARTPSRGASSNIASPNPSGVAAMPRSSSKQASSSKEEGQFQNHDDDISWNRKQPVQRRKKRSMGQSLETEDFMQDSSSHPMQASLHIPANYCPCQCQSFSNENTMLYS